MHEYCNCTSGVDQKFCSKACERDPLCKGHVNQGDTYCQIATTGGCPTSNECTKHQVGINDDLDPNVGPPCPGVDIQPQFQGCFIKNGSGLKDYEIFLHINNIKVHK